MKVLGLASYPIQAAATRYRLEQYVDPLARQGIDLTIRPFLSPQLFDRFYRRSEFVSTAIGLGLSVLKRVVDLGKLPRADVVLVQREAAIFGPPIFEWVAAQLLRRPMVLDLDDATYIAYKSPTYGSIASFLKWFSKTDDLIRWSRIVTCGNRSIAAYVTSKGGASTIIPTVVDTELFRPIPKTRTGPIVLGWVGTHSTFPFLERIFPVLCELAKKHEFRLRIIGSGRKVVDIPGVQVENSDWDLEREVADFQSIDIGLYPIDLNVYDARWAAGKSGFKAIQYMAVGIPYVASPVGASAEIGEEGVTHYLATTEDQWRVALDSLLSDRCLCDRMGAAGREHVIRNYSLATQTDRLVVALREAAENGEASR